MGEATEAVSGMAGASPEPASAGAQANPQTTAPVYAAPTSQAPPIYAPQSAQGFQRAGFDSPPPKSSPYAVMGTGAYIGHSILFAIPVVGWLICVIMAFSAKNLNKRHYARAVLIFLVIGAVLSVSLYFLFSWVWDAAAEYLQQYINDATGGAVNDLGGLGDIGGLGGLLDLLKELPAQ
jgi:hypothetical protein